MFRMRVFVQIIMLLIVANSRIYNNQFTMPEVRRNKGWIFLDRMSFDSSIVEVQLSLQIQTPTQTNRDVLSLQLSIIPDTEWAQQLAFQCNKQRTINNTIILGIDVMKSQNYYAAISHQFTIQKPESFHFVLRDCRKILSNQYFRKQTKLKVNLEMKNGQYSHSSDQYSNKFMLPLLILLSSVMAYYSKSTKTMQTGQQRDWAKFVLFITIAMNLIAIIIYYFGFLVYLKTGQHYGFFDFMYMLFHSISQSILTSLLIFIAFGWTINFTNDVQFDLYIPLVSMLGLINLILTLLGKITDGDSDKYHMYDTIPSYLLVFFRIVTVIIFFIGIVKLYFYDCAKNNVARSFLGNFGFMGGIYFLSLPAIMLIANLLPFSQRKQIVFFSVQLIKNGINLVLTWMVSSKKSKYRSIKQSSQSFFTSGNKVL